MFAATAPPNLFALFRCNVYPLQPLKTGPSCPSVDQHRWRVLTLYTYPVTFKSPFFEDQTKFQTVWPQPYFDKSKNCLPNPVAFRFLRMEGVLFEFFA